MKLLDLERIKNKKEENRALTETEELYLFLCEVEKFSKQFSLSFGSVDYVRQCKESLEGLFSLAKFEIDETVVLKKTLEIKEDSGWYCYRPTFVEGARGKVTSCEFWHGSFNYTIEFEHEFHVYDDGIEKETIDRKHVFLLNEDKLAKEEEYKNQKEKNELRVKSVETLTDTIMDWLNSHSNTTSNGPAKPPAFIEVDDEKIKKG